MTAVSRHFVLAAGGTGGHLSPAFALAQELNRRGHKTMLITDERGAAIPGKPDFLEAHVLPAGRFGRNPILWPRSVAAILKGRSMSQKIYQSFAPSVVIGFGGYPALPALLGAEGMGVPTVIHEQNAVLGRVNRLLAGRVNAIATAYPQIRRLAERHVGKVHLVGNPVREAILALRNEPFPAISEGGPIRILVTGGSQGAGVLAQVVPAGLSRLPADLRARIEAVQQCRPEDLELVEVLYEEYGIKAKLATYFEDMAAEIARIHLVIGRAGASTLAEMTVAGRPAILVPLPSATNDHQTANVRELVAAGAARMIRQPEFTPQELAKQVLSLISTDEALATAAHAAWNCGRPNAAKDLADLVEGFGGSPIQDVIRVSSTESARTRAVPSGVGTAT